MVIEPFALVRVQRVFVKIEDVVWLFCALGGRQGRLYFKCMPQRLQHRFHKAIFCLRLILTGLILLEDRRDLRHHRLSLYGKGLPIGTLWQGISEVLKTLPPKEREVLSVPSTLPASHAEAEKLALVWVRSDL